MNAPLTAGESTFQWMREQPDYAAAVRLNYYDDPLSEAAERFRSGAEWRATRALLPGRPGRALDLGAGRGIASYALARDGWRAVALEPDPSPMLGAGAMRILADETKVPLEILRGVGEAMPFADGSFDLVYCRQALHHARDLPALCREAGRILAPGGLFLAVREHVVDRPADLASFLNAHPLHAMTGGEFAYSVAAYRAAITGGGLRMRAVFNPWQSAINMFPSNASILKGQLADRLHLPFLRHMSDRMLGRLGALNRKPGRVYTFLAEKPRGG